MALYSLPSPPNSQVLVDLALLTVLAEHAPENTLPPHPENLGGHASLSSSLPLSGSSVASLGLSGVVSTNARARVDRLGLDNDVTILAERTDAVRKKREPRVNTLYSTPAQPRLQPSSAWLGLPGLVVARKTTHLALELALAISERWEGSR